MLHVGLVFDCTDFDCFNGEDPSVFRATVQGYWTTIKPKCDPRTQGFWKRICDGELGNKKLHPETPEGFNEGGCEALMVKGKNRRDPCIRAKAQFEALQFNVMYGYLSRECKVELPDGTIVTAGLAEGIVETLLFHDECKEAADLAESINSGDALV